MLNTAVRDAVLRILPRVKTLRNTLVENSTPFGKITARFAASSASAFPMPTPSG